MSKILALLALLILPVVSIMPYWANPSDVEPLVKLVTANYQAKEDIYEQLLQEDRTLQSQRAHEYISEIGGLFQWYHVGDFSCGITKAASALTFILSLTSYTIWSWLTENKRPGYNIVKVLSIILFVLAWLLNGLSWVFN